MEQTKDTKSDLIWYQATNLPAPPKLLFQAPNLLIIESERERERERERQETQDGTNQTAP
jgi:hypothetical protein